MGRRRRIALLMLCAVSLSMIVGSSAFTSTSPERSVDVDVVEDENAYLGIQNETVLGCGTPKQNTILQNQFLTELDTITVEVRNPPTSKENVTVGPKGNKKSETLAPGESTEIEFDGSYSTGDGPQLHISRVRGTTPEVIYIAVVNATGPGMEVSAEERKFRVECGNGN